jgi:hypothetical protein
MSLAVWLSILDNLAAKQVKLSSLRDEPATCIDGAKGQ